ncbi:MAG: hypothetical protein IT327_23845 [Anaerolineae bacterium]|nr:hypothetical protein [Anaerolineae bacterium]
MHKRLNGSRVINRTIRPPRIAYIIQTVEHCDFLTQVCSLNWGGKHFCIIPYKSSTGISEEWWNVLSKYDPDAVMSFVDLDEQTQGRLLKLTAKNYLLLKEEDKKRSHDRIPIWENPVPDASAITGLSVYSVLASLGAYNKREDFLPALVPKMSSDNPLALYVKARYGCLNEDWVSSILNKGHLRYDLNLEKFIPLKLIELGDDFDFLNFILRREPPTYGETEIFTPLLEYTIAGLDLVGKDQTFYEYEDNSSAYDAQFLLIVSEDISVEDFCWFWNLRSQPNYQPYNKLPLWLPRALVKTQKAAIARLLGNGFLLSKSIPHSELQTLAQELGDNIEVVTENLDKFYSRQYVPGIRDEYEVYFEEGKVRIPVPQADVIKNCQHPNYYYVDIEIPNFKLPSLNPASWGFWNFTHYRTSRTGLSFLIFGNESQKYITFALPTPWEMLETFAGIAGFSIELSDKGIIGERLIKLLGDVKNLWLLSGKSVFNLFDQLAELDQAKEFKSRLRNLLAERGTENPDNVIEQILQTIASDYHQRVTKQYSAMDNLLEFERDTAKKFIKWLIERHLIFRGVDLKCPVCGTKQWLYIDNMHSTMQCIGCQESVNIPVRVDVIHWQYRINTLYAKAHEQGLIPHLLTLNHCIQQERTKIQGLFPGIKLKANEGVQLPISNMEVDIAWIEDGELVIGECKTHFRELLPEEVNRYLSLAELIRCKQIVFSALDDFDQIDSKVKGLIDAASIPILLLNGEMLFNHYPRRRQISEDTDDGYTSHDTVFKEQVKIFFDWMKSAS